MRFTPKLEEELNNFLLLEEGIYQFKIVKAEDKVSKNGNDMIEVKLIVFDKEGKIHFITDYLLEKIAYKLKHFTDCVGLGEKYKTGEFSAFDCEGREGYLKLNVQKGKEKPEGGYYPDKNSVEDYIVKEKKEYVDLNKLASKDEFNDDLPF